MAIIYAKTSGGGSANSGSGMSVKVSAGGCSTSGASLTSLDPIFSAYAFDANDYIRIALGSSATPGFYRVTAKVDDYQISLASAPGDSLGNVQFVLGGALDTAAGAVGRAQAGDEIRLCQMAAGEKFQVTATLSPPAGLAGRFTAITGANAAGDVDGTLCPIDGLGTASLSLITSAASSAYLIVRNLELYNAHRGVDIAGFFVRVEGCLIRDLVDSGVYSAAGRCIAVIGCRIKGCASGILVTNQVTAFGNVIDHNTMRGIYIGTNSNAYASVVNRNVIHGNGRGLELGNASGCPLCLIAANTLDGNGEGVRFVHGDQAESVAFLDNVFSNNATARFYCVTATARLQLHRTLSFGNGADSGVSVATDSGSAAGDPLFADAAAHDFRLRLGSPAIRMGTGVFPDGVNHGYQSAGACGWAGPFSRNMEGGLT